MSEPMNSKNAETATHDFRRSWRARRQSWFGLKKHVKDAASSTLPHAGLRFASRYVPRLRSGRLPAPRGLREVVGKADGASFTMLRPDRCENAKELYWGEGIRPRPEDANALNIVMRLIRTADVFFDIGAYTGLFTLATTAVNKTLTAHAFEIVPAVADLLEANVARNELRDRVVVHREGVGVPCTSVTVPSGEGGSALPSFYSTKTRFESGAEVPVQSLDSLDELVGPGQRVVMKIDVEGTELDVLGNGVEFLTKHRPDILCEVLYGVADAAALNELLRPLGYSFYLVGPSGMARRPSISADPRFRDWVFSVSALG